MRRLKWMVAVAMSLAAGCIGGEENLVDNSQLVSHDHELGQLSPLIPLPIDAIHAGLSWGRDGSPRLCFGMRPSEYRGFDLVDEQGELRPIFEELVYGGFGFSEGRHGLDTANTKGDVRRENFVCWDLSHPDAFNDTGEFSIVDEAGEELVSQEDFALNADSFTDAGHSAGLNYNVFCSGNVALADGRWLFVGGHDKSGNNGIRKLNIFDPRKLRWADRGMPAVKRDFLADPEGLTDDHADPLDEANTDPPHPSDMKYQRWYPSAVVLPDKKVLVLSGTDQDTSLRPPGTMFQPCTSVEQNAACSKERYGVPEVYSPSTDRAVALENANKLLAMYPRSYVVQTGPGWDDWKVAVISRAHPDYLPGLGTIGQYDPWYYDGGTYFLDVQAALEDPDRDVPGEHHWEPIDSAAIGHDSGAGAQLWKLDRDGRAVSQRVALFGGGCGRVPRDGPFGPPLFPCDRSIVEMIDFEDATPTWQLQQPLIKPASQNNAVVLPTGKVVIMGGTVGRGPWDNTLALQLFDPDAGTTTPLVETKVPRHDHSTAALLPDGSVAILGGNATDLAGDVEHLEAGIPVAQIYRPAYLFKGDPPRITASPYQVRYGKQFKIQVQSKRDIASVVLIRAGPVTHNWDWGNRYVELWHKESRRGPKHRGERRRSLTVRAPAVPGLAVPGKYQLFVVDEAGVPSKAAVVQLDYPPVLGHRDR